MSFNDLYNSILQFSLKCYEDLHAFLSNVFCEFITEYMTDMLTPKACWFISHSLASIISLLIFLRILIWLYQGFSYVVSSGVSYVLMGSSSALNNIYKGFFVRVFTTIGWIFTSIGNSLRKLLFGKK